MVFGALLVPFFLWSLLGSAVSAVPAGIQVACATLIGLAVALAVLMIRERNRALGAMQAFQAIFKGVTPGSVSERTSGLSPSKLSDIRRRAALLKATHAEWWRSIDESLEQYTGPDGQEGWFVTRPIAESLPAEQVLTPFYHFAFHASVPGILTALGLLATFVSILLALSGVTYSPGNLAQPVSGIDSLINGLSGKFLCSIVALILSVLFTFLEKKVCERQIFEAYHQVIERCREVFPYLTQARILLDIQRIVVQNSDSMRVGDTARAWHS